jgi:hypothetical protein
MRVPRHRLLVVVPAATVLLTSVALAGVAGAGDARLSQKDWRKAANAICVKADKRAKKVITETFGDVPRDEQPSLEQMTTYIAGIEPIITQLVNRIEGLHEPKNLEKKVKRFVATARRELDEVVADPSIGLESNPFSDTSLRADALGVKACA